jgi:hypothetical protein
MTATPTVVVGGALANKPGKGGEAWVRLSWVRALQSLGFDTRFVEQLDATTCVDPEGRRCDVESSVNLAYFRDVVAHFGLQDRATLIVDDKLHFGAARDELDTLAPDAALVNISGHLRDPALLRAFRVRAYVDIDPGFTQLWHASGESGLGLDDHDVHFTIGTNLGTSRCALPTGGFEWIPIRQPVVLDDWTVTHTPDAPLTTVASWRGAYGPIEHDGRHYGLRVHEFRKFIDIPKSVPQRVEVALDIDAADHRDRIRLLERGWELADPAVVADNPDRFREYVQKSAGEVSVAQGMYVESRCGWFSDRTVRYLASGKPALVQDTGFNHDLPTGLGLLSFSSLDDVVNGAGSIAARYDEHCEAARDIAEHHFTPVAALAPLLDRVAA